MDRASSATRFQRSGGGPGGGGGAGVHGELYLPSLQNGLRGRFENAPLESAYQRYSHRQRQKSFIVVNGVDVALKIIAVVLISVHFNHLTDPNLSEDQSTRCRDRLSCDNVTTAEDHTMHSPHHDYPAQTVTWTSCLIVVNILLCLLAFCWKCFANNYLHWAALATWLLMNLQGNTTTFIVFF